RALVALLFQLGGALEESAVLLGREISQLEEVSLHSGASFSSSKSAERRGTPAAAWRARSDSCSRKSICSSMRPVPPALRFRATEARGSAAASTEASKRGSISRAISSENGFPPERGTSSPV